jgi:hypothetical protein
MNEMRRPATFRESDILRAVKGAQKAGLCVAGIICHPDGSIEVLHGEPTSGRLPIFRNQVQHDAEYLRWQEVKL